MKVPRILSHQYKASEEYESVIILTKNNLEFKIYCKDVALKNYKMIFKMISFPANTDIFVLHKPVSFSCRIDGKIR
jgi:hypothetical protein